MTYEAKLYLYNDQQRFSIILMMAQEMIYTT